MFRTGNQFAPLKFKPGITPDPGETPAWSSVGQAGSAIVIAASILIQYPAVTGPVFVPSAAAPLNWQPKYPDRIERPSFQAAHQQAFAAGFLPIIPTLTSWEPLFPDRNPTRDFPTAEQKAWTGPTAPPAAPTPTGWLGTSYPATSPPPDVDIELGRIGLVLPIEPPFSRATYPDWFPPPWQRWLVGGEVHPVVFTAPPAAPPLSWAPRYPDRLDVKTYPTAEQLAFVSGFPPIIPSAAAWKPIYPDRPTRAELPVAVSHQFFAAGFLPIIPSSAGWKPVYPDRVWRAELPQGVSNLSWAAGFVPIVSKASWQPVYPDIVPRAPQAPWMQFYAGPVSPPQVAVTPLGWLGTSYPPRAEGIVDLEMGRSVLAFPPDVPLVLAEYPDLLPRRPFLIIGGEVKPPFFTAAVVPLGSWYPYYPSQFWRPFPEAPFVVGAGTILPPTPPRGWYPTYPDRFPQPYVPPASGLTYTFVVAGAAAPLESWLPVYPVIHRVVYPIAPYTTGARNIFPIPAVAPFGWAAFYPDRFPQPFVPPPSGRVGPVTLVAVAPSTESKLVIVSASFGTITITGTIRSVS